MKILCIYIRQKVLLSVNRKIAEKFGLPLSSEIVRKADEVY